MNYLHWNETTITDFSSSSIGEMYEKGYVFTRIGKGVMHQTRSVRIDLNGFELTSENRRILKKVSDISVEPFPIPYKEYDWSIAKLAKDFYTARFGHGIKSIMGAAKIKEMLTDPEKSNFNYLLIYNQVHEKTHEAKDLGYTISYMNDDLLHYCYPFYELDKSPKDMGLGMMTMAIQFAKEKGLRYVYLGSLQRPSDTYKLQFEGLEWFDGTKWRVDIEEVKKLLSSVKMEK